MPKVSSIRAYTWLVLMCLMIECYRSRRKPRLPPGVRTWMPRPTSPNPDDAEDTDQEATQCSSDGGPKLWGSSILGSHTSETLTSVMGICGLGLTSSLLPFSGNNTSLISFGPSLLSHSQTMKFAQGVDPIPDLQVGHMTHAGSQGEPFLGL